MITNKESQDAFLAQVEKSLRNRLEALEIKLGSKRALTEEAAFMSGAMVAINALVPNHDPGKISSVIPPRWIMAPLRGCSVLVG